MAINMKDAVQKAASLAHFGGVVLLSPAAPSYGTYKDFQERGEDFLRCVNELE